MTYRARSLRRVLPGLAPVLAASAAVAATGLPALASGQPGHPVPWWLGALHLPAADQAAPAAGRGVTVAVLSTGADASHPDLAGSVTAGPDFSQTGRKPGSGYWGDEGTAVASLIAGHGHGAGRTARSTGDAGITGVAPGARVLSVQVTLEYDDPLTTDAAVTGRLPAAIAAGIRYAVGHGASVIALPLDPGTLDPSATADTAGGSAAERAAVGYALAHDVVLIAPAGDNGAGANAVNFPAADRGVLAVGATARDGALAPFTSRHSYVALTAPGSGDTPAVPVPGGTAADPAAGLTVAAPDGGYQSLASTDMSAALTAGVAALIRSRYPRLTAPEVTQALERGAALPAAAGRPAAAGWGHGALNATAALTAAAAIAAAHPGPAASAPSASTSPASAPPSAVPAATLPQAKPPKATRAAGPDPGHLLRSLVTWLAVAAGALIACLIAAIALVRLRRRRAARTARAGTGPARGPGHPRHARGQATAAAAGSGRPPAAPGAFPATGSAAFPAAGSGAFTAAGPGFPAAGAAVPPAAGSAAFTTAGPGDFPAAGAAVSRGARPADEMYPWPPAAPPGTRLPIEEAFLPAPHEPGPDAALPPWEKSPADFAAAPPPDDLAPGDRAAGDRAAGDRASWPVTNTGPMYVWNPAATGPLSLPDDDHQD